MAKKRKPLKKGTKLYNVEDNDFVIQLTEAEDPKRESYQGEIIQGGKHRIVGDYSQFWLKSRFKKL